MDTQTRSIEDITLFARYAQQRLGDPKKGARLTKFNYALGKVLKSATSVLERYNSKVQDLNIDYAATDADGYLLEHEGRYRYKPDQLKLRNEKQQELYRKDVQVGQYFATELPKDLTWQEREAFAGFVIEDKEPVFESEELEGDKVQQTNA